MRPVLISEFQNFKLSDLVSISREDFHYNIIVLPAHKHMPTISSANRRLWNRNINIINIFTLQAFTKLEQKKANSKKGDHRKSNSKTHMLYSAAKRAYWKRSNPSPIVYNIYIDTTNQYNIGNVLSLHRAKLRGTQMVLALRESFFFSENRNGFATAFQLQQLQQGPANGIAPYTITIHNYG